MNLRQAEDYLLGLELFGMRFGLDRMHKLMTVLGMPQRRFESIHVVGTNGKSLNPAVASWTEIQSVKSPATGSTQLITGLGTVSPSDVLQLS